MLVQNRCGSLFALLLLAGSSLVGCGTSDPTGSGGTGTISFTTWGEDYVQVEIPPDSSEVTGFVDGWTIEYAKFLVNFQKIEVADQKGHVAASMDGSMLFDNHVEGVKPIIAFKDVEAKAWARVSYAIAPVTADTKLSDSATEADRKMMEEGGYSFYVDATATKGDVTKHLAWGFAIGTRYQECHSEQDGKDEAGVVVTNNSDVEVQLTTHGDHLYYDRLQASPDPAILTSLRFDTLAADDNDGDGEITLEELNGSALNVKSCSEKKVPCYDPSGLGAATQGAFVTSLARTIGHFRGEGECEISGL
jgi:hypothetical protein